MNVIQFNVAVVLLTIASSLALPVDDINGRIFGGNTAEPGQFPFIVSINHKVDGRHWCGGSIINNNWILTAAHCLTDIEADELSVLAGTNSLNSSGTTYNVSKIIPHPGFNYTLPVPDDIGLLKINGDFETSDLIQITEIANVSGNDPCTIVGWGLTESGIEPVDLAYADITALSLDDCMKFTEEFFELTPGQVCALGKNGTGPCFGDSGGPLISNGKVVGTVSFAINPCARGYPDIYTRVAYYIEWINEIIRNF